MTSLVDHRAPRGAGPRAGSNRAVEQAANALRCAVADVFLALMLLRTLFVTARGRYAPALVAATAGLALWAGLAVSGWIYRAADARGPWGALFLIFLGPSSVPGRAASVPFSELAGAHPVVAHAFVAGVLFAGFAATWRHAGRVSELHDEAVRRKDVGLALLAPALLILTETVCLALGEAVGATQRP